MYYFLEHMYVNILLYFNRNILFLILATQLIINKILALTVRYLTSRYIRDYMSGEDQFYKLEVGDPRCPPGISIRILDTSSTEVIYSCLNVFYNIRL